MTTEGTDPITNATVYEVAATHGPAPQPLSPQDIMDSLVSIGACFTARSWVRDNLNYTAEQLWQRVPDLDWYLFAIVGAIRHDDQAFRDPMSRYQRKLLWLMDSCVKAGIWKLSEHAPVHYAWEASRVLASLDALQMAGAKGDETSQGIFDSLHQYHTDRVYSQRMNAYGQYNKYSELANTYEPETEEHTLNVNRANVHYRDYTVWESLAMTLALLKGGVRAIGVGFTYLVLTLGVDSEEIRRRVLIHYPQPPTLSLNEPSDAEVGY